MKTNKTRRIIYLIAVVLLLEVIRPVFFGGTSAQAIEFNFTYVMLHRHKINEHTGGTVCASPSTAGTEAYVDITFPDDATNDFQVGTVAGDWNVDNSVTDSWPEDPDGAGAIDVLAWPGMTGNEADSVSGRTVRFDSGDLTQDDIYCFNWVQGTNANRTLQNPAAADYQFMTGAGQAKVQTLLTDGTTIVEETNWSTAIINEDTITVTAVVPPLFQINMSDVDQNLGDLDPDNVVTSDGIPIQIKTNAKSGWIMWVKDSEQGLTSSNAGYTIPTSDTVDGTPTILVDDGTSEGYVLDADITGGLLVSDGDPRCDNSLGNGTLVIDPEYDAPGLTPGSHGGTLSANFQKIATCAGSTPPNTTDGDFVTLFTAATIAYSTPAATDYTDEITVVAAGNF